MFDWSKLDELRDLGLSSAETAEIAKRYITDSQQNMEHIQVALAGRDRDAVKSLAHRLKSASGQVGAQGVFELCLQLEMAAAGGDEWAGLEKLGRDLHAQLAQANAALGSYRERLSA